jgi:hypothetical protein
MHYNHGYPAATGHTSGALATAGTHAPLHISSAPWLCLPEVGSPDRPLNPEPYESP